jgi:hypothetical protein
MIARVNLATACRVSLTSQTVDGLLPFPDDHVGFSQLTVLGGSQIRDSAFSFLDGPLEICNLAVFDGS